jgi:hypothetical protein
VSEILGANYRLVIAPPKAGKSKSVCWCEYRRAPQSWMPPWVARWWTRWRRVSKVHRLGVKDVQPGKGVTSGIMPLPHRWVGFRDRQGTRYIPLVDEQEWRRMALQFDEVGA